MNKQLEVLPANDPGTKPGNPHDLRDFDIAIIVDTPGGCGVGAGLVEFDGDRIAHLSQVTVSDRYFIYVVALYGNQLYDAPFKVSRNGVVRAFTFGDKIRAWLREDNDTRAETLRRQVRTLGTDIARMIEEAIQLR